METDTKRISRLTALLTRLQTKKIITATELANQFNVSVRTIYRDIKALQEANIPIFTEEGKGYSLIEGYRIPPVMFTEAEANALITAEKLVAGNKDSSLIKDYNDAVLKIKAVLQYQAKDKVDLLSSRVVIRQNVDKERTSDYLSVLQKALTNFNLVNITYYSPDTHQETKRDIEPFALYSTQENWLLVAWCRIRNDYRSFRLDRIKVLQVLGEKFEKHQLSIHDYFEICKQKSLSNP